MCHYLGGGLHGRQKRVKAQSESSKSVVNSVLISREMPVFPGFLEIIRVVIRKILLSCFDLYLFAAGKFCNLPGSAVKIRKQCRLTAVERSVKKPLRRIFFVSTVVKRKFFTVYSIYF